MAICSLNPPGNLAIVSILELLAIEDGDGHAIESLFQKPYAVVRLRGRLYRNQSRYFAPVSRRSIN